MELIFLFKHIYARTVLFFFERPRRFFLARTCLEGYLMLLDVYVFLMKGGLSDVDGQVALNLDAGALWRRDLFPAPNTSPRDYGAT